MRDEHESDGIADLGTLARAFVGPFGDLAGRVKVSCNAEPLAFPLARLIAQPTFDQVLARYAGRFTMSDCRPVASLWSQYCFGVLIVPFVAIGLLGGRLLPVSPASIGLVLEDGLPSGLQLPHVGWPARHEDIFEGLDTLVRGQIASLVVLLAARSGASPRLFWGNAAVRLGWALGETAALLPGRPDSERLRRRLLDAPTWPDGQPNPLFDTLRPPIGSAEQCRRRVCCVRYLLPGVPGCGTYCPLGR